MIKCNVAVCGTVSRQAQMRANKEGTQFASFGINIVIPAKSGINKTVEISVAKTCNNLSELPPIQVGTRIEVTGILMFHKKGEALYLNLSATGINTFNASNNDGINGTMEFRGTLGKQIEDKTTKSGKSFTVFSAYSSEKDGDNYTYTWVRFMQFDKRKETWMQPKAGINAKGDLELGVYNNRLDLTCRISECSLWEKNSNTYQH